MREKLMKFIGDFANWDNAAKATYLDVGRGLVRAAHNEESPLVVDPFAGGGSIPLEALRLGCETFASDLNPVACLILKVTLEDIPRHRPGLAEELNKAGTEIQNQAEKNLADLYPKDPDGSKPIAYIWARTVRCVAPNCGAEIPLIPSLWLCKIPKRKWALRPRIVQNEGEIPRVEFEIYKPQIEEEVDSGTVSRARATCLCCRAVLPPEQVRPQLVAQRGGTDTIFDEHGDRTGGARMTAVVILKPGEKERHYRLPTEADYAAVYLAQKRVANMLSEWECNGKQGICPVPDEPTPIGGGSGAGRAFSVHKYGMVQWNHLFTARQKIALMVVSNLIKCSHFDGTVRSLLAFALNAYSRACNGNARLRPNSSVAPSFGMQTLPITWSFPETVLSGGNSAHLDGVLSNFKKIIEILPQVSVGQFEQADATHHPLHDQAAHVWFTDPPYYDAIPYADLSDFFLVWLKRTLPDLSFLRDPLDLRNQLSPKNREIVQDETKKDGGRKKNRAWFEENMADAFSEGRRILSEDGVGSVVFAHKTTEGWEALLSGMIQGGWTITGSWPIATEATSRIRARESAALATSVHLICRPRPDDAPVGEWADVLRELPNRVADWMQRLQGEGIRGADLVFACVGPALEIYSRYRSVETAEGREIGLPEYLEKVWEVVGREALEQVLGTAEAQARNGAAGALEEDARLTALFLWTLQSTGNGGVNQVKETDEKYETPRRRISGYSLPFDVARRFAQPLGIHLNEWESRIIEIEKGVVRLRSVNERSKELFGEFGAGALADEIETNPTASVQLSLFPDDPPTVRGRTRRRGHFSGQVAGDLNTPTEATTLDRVHAAMLFQASGRTEALRSLLRAEQERGPGFLRLANALTALYTPGSDEKRLLDAMLLAVPR